MHPLEVKELVKKYGKLTAVNKVSFHINDGEIFGLLGPNGAGKTTAISIISTLEKATSGEIKIFGKDLKTHPSEIKKQVGVVPQELLTNGFFTVEEVLKIQSGYFGIKYNDSWVEFITDSLELAPYLNRMANRLSGGLKRRLLIAKALVNKPKLLLLDEPTAGVDIDLRQKLWDFVRELNKQGVSILLTTHYLEEAEKLCNRVAIIHYGKILKIEETKKLIETYTCRKVTFYFTQIPPKIVSSYMIEQDEKSVTLKLPRSVNIGEVLKESKINWEILSDIKMQNGTLEDAFNEVIKSYDKLG